MEKMLDYEGCILEWHSMNIELPIKDSEEFVNQWMDVLEDHSKTKGVRLIALRIIDVINWAYFKGIEKEIA